MIKKLLITYLFTVSSVMAGLPPTTIKNQNAASKTVNFNLELPNNQSVPTAASTALITTGNKDELQNSNFEHSAVTTGWTVSNATASGNTANPLEGKKSLSLALTGALSLSQSSTINAAQKSGVQMVASVWVNSADVSDLQLCSLKNGSEDKCTVTGGYVQGSGWRQLTVSFLGNSTSNGLKLKSTDTTGTVLVDQAYVGIGSPIVDFTPDMVFSAKVSSTGVVTDENTDWINGNCTVSTGNVCTFKSGVFTVTPNCWMVSATTGSLQGNTGGSQVYNVSVNGATFAALDATNSVAARNQTIYCQKQGADYKTSKAYVASSSGAIFSYAYGTPAAWSANAPIIYPTVAYNLGGAYNASTGEYTVPRDGYYQATVFNQSNNYPYVLYLSRNGGSTVGVNAVNIASSAASPDYKKSGSGVLFANKGDVLTIRQSTSSGTTGQGSVSFTYVEDVNGVIVGSFQGYNETPGTSRVETFKYNFYGANPTTTCSSGTCTTKQIGTNVSKVERTALGTYLNTFSKTYSAIQCVINGVSGASSNIGYSKGYYCESCNSLSMLIANTNNTALSDGWGFVDCQGIPQ